MAITATISCAPDPVQINQKVTATITVSNSGSSAVTVQGIRLSAQYTGDSAAPHTSVSYGSPNLSAGATTSVAASGSTVFPVDLTFFAPSTGLLSAGVGTYDVTAFIQTSDGSYISPTADTITVNNITFPSSQQ
jgi:hypothetical protein